MNKRKRYLIVDSKADWIDVRDVDVILNLVYAKMTSKNAHYEKFKDVEFKVCVSERGHIYLSGENENGRIDTVRLMGNGCFNFYDFFFMNRELYKFYVDK